MTILLHSRRSGADADSRLKPRFRWEERRMGHGLTRREVLQAGVGAGATFGAAALLSDPLLRRALADPPRCGSLRDIEHVVILIQENRSFDHYFGTYRG